VEFHSGAARRDPACPRHAKKSPEVAQMITTCSESGSASALFLYAIGIAADSIETRNQLAVWQGERTWNGVAILRRGGKPVLTRRGLPGDKSDIQARYIEAAADGVLVSCIYLPNGNPQPGAKFAYKLTWFDRLIEHASTLLELDAPVVLAGDYNVVPTDFDIYPTKSWAKDALVQPEPRACFRRLLEQGWTDALRTLHPDKPMYTFWHYLRHRWERDAGLRLDHLLLNRPAAERLVAAGVHREVRGAEGASDHAPAWVELKGGRRSRRD
jgi:exodeoxyribonuclease-3